MSNAVSALAFPVVSTSKSLKEELADRNIPTIPKSEVRDHKRAYVRSMRPGAWRFGAPVLVVLGNILRIVSFEIFAEKISPKDQSAQEVSFSIWFVLNVMVGICSLIAGWVPGIVPLVALALLVVIAFNKTLERRLGAGWTKVKFANFCQTYRIPSKIQDRIAIVQGIEGTTVAIELYEEDPFVLVSRGPWYSRETEYFGAWNTGNPKLDSY